MTDPLQLSLIGPGSDAPGAEDLPADRVFLRDYVAQIEIGAYAEEQGVVQRLRFNISLEVQRNSAHLDDRVGRVINYDLLVQAIHDLAGGGRITLLETFAERLAQALLVDPRARRVTIRIEKLDRLHDGASLGCEITRKRSAEANEHVWALATEPTTESATQPSTEPDGNP
ncbi:MAG: dihydroneopterin aldolase [Pseudomonadota bacterium]